MYKAVKTVIDANQSAWTSLAAFGSSFQAFANRLGALEESAYQQNLSMIGVSAVKNAKRAMVIDRAYAISSGMVAYAVVNNNVELINHMKISRNDMDKAGKSELLVLVDRVIARATDYLGQLADYGVDQTVVDELQTLRDELYAQLSAPRHAVIERKNQTVRIKTLEQELDAILKLQLDKLMVVLKEEYPDFFTAYTNARVIIDLKSRRTNSDSAPEDRNPDRDDGTPDEDREI